MVNIHFAVFVEGKRSKVAVVQQDAFGLRKPLCFLSLFPEPF